METKDETPKPNQKEIKKKYTLKDPSNYTLNIIFNLEQLTIEIEQNDSLPILFYKSAFILSEVQKTDKWFRQFDSFLECFEVINGLFNDNKVTIINENNNKINLIISHLEKNIPDSKFVLEKKDFQEKDKISRLLNLCKKLNKKIKSLEEENKELKEIINNISTILNKSKYLNTNNPLPKPKNPVENSDLDENNIKDPGRSDLYRSLYCLEDALKKLEDQIEKIDGRTPKELLEKKIKFQTMIQYINENIGLSIEAQTYKQLLQQDIERDKKLCDYFKQVDDKSKYAIVFARYSAELRELKDLENKK